jgi:hypothetical protein
MIYDLFTRPSPAVYSPRSTNAVGNLSKNKPNTKQTKKMTLYRRALGGPVAVLLFFGAETYPPRVPSVLVTAP